MRSSSRERGVDRLRPEACPLVRGQLLELEPEDVRDRSDRRRPHLLDGDRRSSSRAIVVNAASSSPQAVIQSVNGAGSRSTFSA